MTPTVTLPQSQQELLVLQAAGKWGLNPRTLWGIYGTESAYGTNEGPSSQGALGPFQFLPSTGQLYGLTSGPSETGTIWNFSAAVNAAAAYLKHLGANNSPNSPQTITALNAYNGNKSGSALSAYAQQVISNGGSLAPNLSNNDAANAAAASSNPGITGVAINPTIPNPLKTLGDVWNAFIKWIPKAALAAGLILAALVLLVVSFGRTTGAKLSPGIAPSL